MSDYFSIRTAKINFLLKYIPRNNPVPKWNILVYPASCFFKSLELQNKTNDIISQAEVRIIDMQINANVVLSRAGTETYHKLYDIYFIFCTLMFNILQCI